MAGELESDAVQTSGKFVSWDGIVSSQEKVGMMRIVGGRWRGRLFDAPEGADVTRPTTERTREALASTLLSARGLDLSQDRVLDAFAGSGAMGLELMSRGAAFCTFVDADRRVAALIRSNCRKLGADDGTWQVVCGDSLRLAGRSLAGGPFSIVFLDPPYALQAEDVSRMMDSLGRAGNLAPEAIVVYEHALGAPTLELAGATPLKAKRMGRKTGVDIWKMA